MGRDHTIFAKEKGYVVFYRDEERHKSRKYIGVVFQQGETLPRAKGKPRVRRLGLVGRPRELSTDASISASTTPPSADMESVSEGEPEVGDMTQAQGTIPQQPKEAKTKVPETKPLELRQGYQYRTSNWEIGRAAERAGVKVRPYKRGDRFLAWRKLNARKARNAERRALSSRKSKGNKGNKSK